MLRNDAARRVGQFIETRSKMRGIDPENISLIQAGSPNEMTLTVGDLEALVPAPVTRDELLRAMDAWGAAAFHVDERAVAFFNYFLGARPDR